MLAVRSLPDHYSLAWSVDIKTDQKLALWLQVLGIGWLGVVFPAFWWLFSHLRPDAPLVDVLLIDSWWFIVWMLVILVISITLHELVHGLFFWVFSRSLPKFGLGWGYAYAAAPDWYFRKWPYLWIGLSPLVVLSLFGMFLALVVPANWLLGLFWGVVVNASGAIGDVYVCWRIAREAEDAWVLDTGDGFQVYKHQGG